MNSSESIATLTKAMIKVQSTMPAAVKNSVNPHLKSRYADLGACWDAARACLHEAGLALIQSTSIDETNNRVVIETILAHESGEWISGQLAMPLQQQTPQAVGSSITYGRRYGMCAMLGLVSNEDDDGVAGGPPVRTPYNPKGADAPEQPGVTDIKKLIASVGDALSAKKCLVTIMRQSTSKEEQTAYFAELSAKAKSLGLTYSAEQKGFISA